MTHQRGEIAVAEDQGLKERQIALNYIPHSQLT